MSSTRTTRLAFFGVGLMGQCGHLRNYITMQDCSVVALADVRKQLVERVAKRWGIEKVYYSAEELLRNEKLDGVVASQPFRRHGTLLAPLLREGIPIFIEKPLASSVEVGRWIVSQLAESKTTMVVGYHKRCDPAVVRARQELARIKATHELGPLRYVRITIPVGDWIAGGNDCFIPASDPKPTTPLDPAPDDMDGETYKRFLSFVDYYIHQVNLLRYLLGEPYRIVFADPAGVTICARSISGVSSTVEMNPYRTTRDWQEIALVAFERGYLKISLPAPLATNRAGRLEIFRDLGDDYSPSLEIPVLPFKSAMENQAEVFARVVRGEEEPPCGAEEALQDLMIAREYFQFLGS